MNRSFIALLVSICALVAFAGSAAAAVTTVAQGPLDFAPVLDGASVLFGVRMGDIQDDTSAVEVQRAGPGGGFEHVAKFPVGNTLPRLDLAASGQATLIALGEVESCSDSGGFEPCLYSLRFRSALAGAALGPIRGCMPANTDTPYNGEGAAFDQPLVAADGTRVALAVDKTEDCGRRSDVKIIDLASPTDVVTVPVSAEYLLGIAMSGRYVAVLSAADVRGTRLKVSVFDRAKKRVVQSRTLQAKSYGDASLDVDADGTVALSAVLSKRVGAKCDPDQSLYHLRPNGRGECIPVSLSTEEVKLSGGKVVFYEYRGPEASRLVAMDLATRSTHVIRTTGDAWQEPFDFDGKRIALSQPGCEESSVVMADFTPQLKMPAVKCPITIGPKSLTIRADRSFDLDVTCPNGCLGSWSVVGPKQLMRDDPDLGLRSVISIEESTYVQLPPSPVAVRKTFKIYGRSIAYLKSQKVKRIKLEWFSRAASLDGRTHAKRFWFDVKYE